MKARDACPTWERIQLLDTTHPEVRWKPEIGGWEAASEALVAPKDYEERYQDLLQAGYSWINLSLYGLYEGTLVVGIELPSEARGVPPGRTSINFSGPPVRDGAPDWQLRLLVVASSHP